MIRIVLGLAIVTATASGVAAENNKVSSLNELAAFATRPASDYTATFRAKLIQTFVAYCQEVLKSLPTNTPTEDAWVASEQKTSDGAKIGRLLNSTEYSRYILKNTFSECKDITTTLVQIQNLPEKEKGTEISARLEASYLVKLALNFNDDLKPYLSKIDLNHDRKIELELLLPTFRRELLTATVKTLQDVP
jgi:hypothetical protein